MEPPRCTGGGSDANAGAVAAGWASSIGVWVVGDSEYAGSGDAVCKATAQTTLSTSVGAVVTSTHAVVVGTVCISVRVVPAHSKVSAFLLLLTPSTWDTDPDASASPGSFLMT